MPNISVEFCGLKFKNPVFASSGPISDSPENVEKCAKGGAGGVVGKTVTAIPELRVYTRPFGFTLDKFGLRRQRIGCGQLFADEAPEEWVKEMLPGILEACDKHDVGFIQSIMGVGTDTNSWVELAQMMAENGVPALELNFSCPHSPAVTKMSGSQLGMDPAAAGEVAAAVRKHIDIPVFAKMTSRCEDVDQVAAACASAGLNGISTINVLTGLWVDVENLSYFGQPAQAWGLPGAYMQPIALQKVAKILQSVNIPVYGGAGIWKAEDALRFILLGNQAVQLQLACMTLGYDIFRKITDGIEQFMDRKGISDLAEIRGRVLPQLVSSNRELPTVAKGEMLIAIDEELCNGCGRCEACMWGVIEVQNGIAKTVALDKCHGCGWCMSLCNKNAMQIEDKNGKVIMKF